MPRQAAISVVTLGELRAGVELSASKELRDARAARLEAVQAAFDPLPVDESVAHRFGEILAWVRSNRRSEKATDLLIVATAGATDRVLYTLDKGQARVAAGVSVAVESP